jgi:predicted nucleic-acid-binding protein
VRAVDTNVLVRLIARDHPKQVESAEGFVAKGAWVSTLVLAEATWVLTSVYDFDAEQLATAVDMLLNHDKITIQDTESVTAALEHFRAHPTLDFSDCLVLEIARRAGHLPLGTFDRSLAKLDGAQRL